MRTPVLGGAWRCFVVALVSTVLVACGGGGGSGGPAVDQAPVATITSPVAGATFRAGDVLIFTGSGTDAEDGALPTNRLEWWADLHHDEHTHPLQLATAGASGSLAVPTRGETSDNIWIRFHLRATDSAGHTTEVTRDALPLKARLTLATDPPGLQVTLDGALFASPKTVTGVVGTERDLGTVADQTLLDRQYRFVGWSQGGAREQTVSTPEADTTYTANFIDVTNRAPQVALSAPATATVGAAVTLSANASDADGTVSRVEFFEGGALIATQSTAPYSVSWVPTAAGTSSITARATDDDGASATSTAIAVTVAPAPNLPPSVSLIAPASATQGVSTTLTAIAADADGSVVAVDFFDGTTLVASASSMPFTAPWVPAAAGARSLSARASDNAGAVTTSAVISINVAPPLNVLPVVALSAPATGTVGVALVLSASASDADGTVTKVEFFDGATLVGTDTSAPYSVNWVPSVAGAHSLTARATDNAGGTTMTPPRVADISPPNNVPPAVSLGAATTVALGVPTALTANATDSDGSVAKVEFFDGTSLIGSDSATPFAMTWVPLTPGVHSLIARATDNAGATSTSAAASVTVTNAPPTAILSAPANATVGVAVGLTATAADGDGNVAKVDFFEGTALIGTDTTSPYALSWTPQIAGGRSLTALATDNFGATTLSAVVNVSVALPPNMPPSVNLSAPASATLGVAVTLSATAADADGSVAKVEFFDGTTLVGSDTTSPYGITWTPATAGTRSLTARATDNAGASATSDVAAINVSAPAVNVPPTVVLSAPAAATVGVSTTLSAVASDSDGAVAKVEFFDGATLLATDTTAPYGTTWTAATTGARSLTARATDNLGAATTSAAVVVTVQATGDTQAPVASLTAPADLTDGVTGTLQITATATDNVAVAGVEFQIDGVTIGVEDTTSPYAVSLDTLAHASGQHVVRARARDTAGNLSAWSTATVRFAGSRFVPAGFSRQLNWIAGLGAATGIAQAPDGRLFVAIQDGRLLVIKNGALLATPFVSLTVDSFGERGLIGVTLHPNFAVNGWVYVYYTRVNGSLRNNRVSRFVANGDVSTGAETVLVDLPALSVAGNHNGGAMNFGLDGKLYVAVGDNANSAKPQNLSDPFGKMLRFNEDGTIPSDNPFCTTQVIQCAVWAYGLRNPFTFAVQPGTGRMHINDVGQSTWEEINLGAARANYGWPASEGPDNLVAGMTAPIFTYKHTDAVPTGSGPGGFFTGVAITGGAFYPSSGPFPARYRGKYFFVDFTGQWISVLDTDNNNAAYAFGLVSGLPVGMLVGADGALYVLSRDTITRFTSP